MGGKSGSSTSTERVEDKETLKTGTLISQFSDSVQNKINDFLSDGVVTTSVVVGGIFLTGYQLFRVEKLAVCSGTNLIYDSWFKINKNSSWNVFSCSSFTEESVEGIISTSDGLITWHLTIRLDSMFEAVQLPTGVTDLYTSLSNVD